MKDWKTAAWLPTILVILLALACLLIRAPTLDRIALNPDESQYESTAAFLLASEQSGFALPHASAGTFTLYKAVAWLFGSYAMFEVRLIVLLLVAGLACLLFELVRREVGPVAGFVTGVVFLLGNLFFEGHSANREWFALPGMWGGIILALAALRESPRHPHLLWILSGALSGTALWFKMQAAYPVLTIPLFLLVWSLCNRDLRGGLRTLALFACGGLASSALYLLAFLRVGTLGSYLSSILKDAGSYAAPASSGSTQPDAWLTWWNRFLVELPGTPLLAAVYALVAAWIFVVLARRQKPTPLPMLLAIHLVLCMAAVAMGGRFFGHYYLFLVPVWAVWIGLGIGGLSRKGAPEKGDSLIWPAVAAAILAFRILVLTTPIAVIYAIGMLLTAVVGWRKRAFWRPLVVGLLLLECGIFAFQAARLPTPDSLPHHRGGFENLRQVIDNHSRADDPILVWGWLPEIYSLTRRTPSTSFVISQYVVQDVYDEVQTPALDTGYEAMMMQELAAMPPVLIIDASARSWTMLANQSTELYDLAQYPRSALQILIDERYERLGYWDGCVVYRHRPEVSK